MTTTRPQQSKAFPVAKATKKQRAVPFTVSEQALIWQYFFPNNSKPLLLIDIKRILASSRNVSQTRFSKEAMEAARHILKSRKTLPESFATQHFKRFGIKRIRVYWNSQRSNARSYLHYFRAHPIRTSNMPSAPQEAPQEAPQKPQKRRRPAKTSKQIQDKPKVKKPARSRQPLRHLQLQAKLRLQQQMQQQMQQHRVWLAAQQLVNIGLGGKKNQTEQPVAVPVPMYAIPVPMYAIPVPMYTLACPIHYPIPVHFYSGNNSFHIYNK